MGHDSFKQSRTKYEKNDCLNLTSPLRNFLVVKSGEKIKKLTVLEAPKFIFLLKKVCTKINCQNFKSLKCITQKAEDEQ